MRPALHALAPTIDDPIELLLACHDKVRRFAGLCLRLRDHLAEADQQASTQADSQAQEAAQSILRYFDVAAPLHHEDEERDLFPALHSLQRPILNACMADLQAEHETLTSQWRAVRVWLQAVQAGQGNAPPPEMALFVQAYLAHAQREEDEVYPAASQLPAEQVKAISAAMVARRTPGLT
jgi:hemerythrin-like domain-containing protein